MVSEDCGKRDTHMHVRDVKSAYSNVPTNATQTLSKGTKTGAVPCDDGWRHVLPQHIVPALKRNYSANDVSGGHEMLSSSSERNIIMSERQNILPGVGPEVPFVYHAQANAAKDDIRACRDYVPGCD
eukprot:scaffold426226_cov45-Prasinocladus_malaysianus.AAC.1